jgi:hypothetical protein
MASSRKFLQPINLLNAASDPGSAVEGDFYYNTTSQTIRYYDGSQWNDVGTGTGGTGITVSETAPTATAVGEGWFKSSTSELFVWDGTFWVEATSTVQTLQLFTVGSTPPSSPSEGAGWFDNVNGDFYIYDGTYWQQVNSVIQLTQMTADIDANGYGFDNVDYIDFDTTTTTVPTEGSIVWNDGDGTLSLGLKGGNVDLDVGQENVVLCYNGSGSAMTVGQVVYISGAQGQRPSITLSDASTDPTSSKTLGFVAEAIANGSEGFVTTFGVIKNIDTFGFTEGGSVYLSTTTGEYTQTKPTQPDHSVFLGYCLKASQTAGRIFVNPQNGYEIEELHNVLITSVSDGDVLAYNSTTSLWENTAGYASEAYVDLAITNLIDSAPATLDTLNELAAALNDDANFASTIASELALKAPLASPTLTGTPLAPTAASGTNTTQIATTEFVQTELNAFSSTFEALPDQTNQAGKYLTTDGTNASWDTVDALPSQTGNDGKYLTTDGTTASWVEVQSGSAPVQTDVALSNSWWLGV